MTDLSPGDRELLLLEAQWIREDIKDERDKIDRYMAVYFAAMYGVTAWVLGKALEQPLSLANADPTLWAFRTRPDFALGLCALPVVNSFFVLLQIDTGARWLALNLQLINLSQKLGSVTAWTWRLDLEGMKTVTVWRWVYLGFGELSGAAVVVGALWFSRPAAARSAIVATCWWTALGMTVTAVLTTLIFVLTARKLIEADLND